MLRMVSIIFGFLFLLVGILGFVPVASSNGLLGGIFHINLLSNVIHIITGGVALWLGLQSRNAARQFFRYFGIFYAVITAAGFIYGEKDILGFVANNAADNWLHLIVAVVSLYFGFIHQEHAQTSNSR